MGIKKKFSNAVRILWPTKKMMRGLKNASYLTIGHFLSLVISFFGFIYVARMLGPSDYGIYTLVGAFVGLFSVVTFRGMSRVILREGAKDLAQMQYYLEKAVGIKILFSFIAIGVCIIASFFTPYSMQVKLYIILFSFLLIHHSFNGFFGAVYQAAEKMQYNAFLEVLNHFLLVSLSIAFLYMGFGLWALFIIALFSRFFTLIINYKLTKRFLSFKFWNKINFDKSLLVPALIFSILAFAVLLSTKIDLVMVSLLGTSRDVGIYGVAFQITHTGVTIRSLLSTGFFPIFVKAYHKNSVRWRSLLKYALIMGLGLLAVATIISLYSEQVITLLFGGEYSESGVILSVLIFYLAGTFFSIPFTNTLKATHNEINILKICWIAPSLNIGLNYLFFNMFGLIGIAYSTLVTSFIGIFITITVTWTSLKKQNKLI